MGKCLLLAAALSLASLLLIPRPVAAGLLWCQHCPQVAIPTQHQPRVTGPIQQTTQSPSNVQRDRIATDAGFNGDGEAVSSGPRHPSEEGTLPSSDCGARADGDCPEGASPTGRSSPALPHGRILDLLLAVEGR